MEKVQNVPVRKKVKKPLRTPSHILRLCLVWCFVICIFLLSTSFFTVTVYINDKLEATPYLQEGDFTYSTLEEIHSAEAELQEAIDGLQKKSDSKSSAADTSTGNSISSMQLEWVYHIKEDIDTEDIKSTLKLIEEAKAVERDLYTDKSVEKLNDAILKAQQSLGASYTISQTALQLMFGGSISEMYGNQSAMDSVTNSIFISVLGIIPVLGFFAASFDKKKHIKHIISMLCSVLAIIDIMFVIYPSVDTGSVFTIIMYIIIAVITIFSIYAKQQEDYIVQHPELEAEYSDKHPHFVKALINNKSFGNKTPVVTKSEQERMAAQNAKKHRNKK